jgi:hypothetical protein
MTNIFLTRLKSFKDLEAIRSQNKLDLETIDTISMNLELDIFYKSINQVNFLTIFA